MKTPDTAEIILCILLSYAFGWLHAVLWLGR